MDGGSIKDALDVVSGLIIIASAIAGAWWFFVQRLYARQIEFDVDANIIKSDTGPTIAEYILTFKNKGRVRVEISSISIWARTFSSGDSIGVFRDSKLNFPNVAINIKNFLDSMRIKFTYLEPGITQNYRLVGVVPDDAIFLLVHGKFGYGKHWEYTAEKVVAIK